MEFKTNDKLKIAFDFVQYTSQNIFLTGKAGTGKTTFLKKLKELSLKRMIIVAPTGVAAINAGGVTIHSFFQLSFAPQVENILQEEEKHKFSKVKIDIMRSLDLLVIDEISMVRADVLDAIDRVLRRYRHSSKPFGGVQLLMIGDLQQLAPVVKDNEKILLESFYDTIFFFGSKALSSTTYVGIELNEVFRQHDYQFVELLNKVRENKLDSESLSLLNKRYIPNFKICDDEDFITLCTHNYQAQKINEKELFLIDKKQFTFNAVINGKFPEYAYPTDFELQFKVGAQVMFVKNDTSHEKLFYNGKIGKIQSIEDKIIYVLCPCDSSPIPVVPLKWENTKYTINNETKEIKEDVEGTFTQYPLKLAWAITIHKSQGLTFEHAIIDVEDAFAHGQVYVALSRCKTIEGLVLSSPITSRNIISDNVVDNFLNNLEQRQPDFTQLNLYTIAYRQEILANTFNFSKLYFLVSKLFDFSCLNKSAFAPLIVQYLKDIQNNVNLNIVSVSERFFSQIAQMLQCQSDVLKNEALLQRIPKAANYFIDRIIIDIQQPLESIDLDIDNKSVRELLYKILNQLKEELNIKSSVLSVCLNRFNVAEVLSVRAKALLNTSSQSNKNVFSKILSKNDVNIPNQELYVILRNWRTQKSKKENVSVSSIFSKKSLIDLVTMLPTDLDSLANIHSFGDKKIKKYGSEIVEIINNYCVKNNKEGAKINLCFDANL